MSDKYENRLSNVLALGAGAQSCTHTALGSPSVCKSTVVIGLYGVPGSGKTFMLKQLEKELGRERFAFYDGSEMIAATIPGGLDAFHGLDEQARAPWRQRAIEAIGRQCVESGQVALVAGHSMFWPEGQESGQLSLSWNDVETTPERIVRQQRANTYGSGSKKKKSIFAASVISMRHTEEYNTSQAEIMDADRTLAAEDTGALFWKIISDSLWPKNEDFPLKTIFSSALGYSYTAFRQAVLLYEETADDQVFETLCQKVATMVTMHPEFVSLLRQVAVCEHIGAVIVTCGLRRVWDIILEREGLSKSVDVVGGGRIVDRFVVTAEVKAALVTHLQGIHKLYVWGFGDSPLDLKMLSKADEAIVVVGEEHTRSRTMDKALLNAIGVDGLRARQVVMPDSASPRLDLSMLPQISLTDREFVGSVLCRRRKHAVLQILHATGKEAAKLLMTPMRDAAFAGPALREAHRRVGWYLGTEFLSHVVGVEETPILHVQGHNTIGHQLLQEQQTLIVALMRGGEPMALGVSDAFPLAKFLHAKYPDDISPDHINGQSTLVFVDSVVNSGKTVVQFVRHVRNLHATIRIIFIAGVIQRESISPGGSIAQAIGPCNRPIFIALRISDNKFTGKGTTDTGNRLFNTTHLL
ncbi:hypothetical protein MBLNU459_g7629t2 [Dothideomycetes sp. NU459]